MSELELSRACREQRWEEVREMITENPQLVWTARGSYGCTPAYWAAHYGDVEMLQHMLAVILRQSLQATSQGDEEEHQQRRQMLRDAFERGGDNGDTPTHEAAFYGHGQCLAFLVEHAPSGAAVLEVKNKEGWIPAHYAAFNGVVDALDFIVRNAPSGVAVLDVKDNKGKTPLDRASKNVKEYFTPQKIMEIGFERELELISNEFEPDSLPSLMFMIIRQNIEIKLYQLSR